MYTVATTAPAQWMIQNNIINQTADMFTATQHNKNNMRNKNKMHNENKNNRQLNNFSKIKRVALK